MQLPDFKLNGLRYHPNDIWLFLLFFIGNIFIANHALAQIDCCQCTVGLDSDSAEICLTKPAAQPCGTVESKIKTKTDPTGKSWSVSCTSIDADKCKKISESASAVCANNPAPTEDITLRYLELIVRGRPTAEPESEPEAEAEEGGTIKLLNIDIPGANFPAENTVESGSVKIPYIAIYVAAIQRYLFGISIIIAAVMIIYGGMMYIVASTGVKYEKAKNVIIDALAGLVLVLVAYVLLINVNPNLVNPPALLLPTVEATPLEYMGYNRQAPGLMMLAGMEPRKNLGNIPVPDDELEPPAPNPDLQFPNYLTIPKECPTRNGSNKAGLRYIGDLSEETINKFLEYQAKTGVPAGALIANMMTEGTSPCMIQNFWNNPAAACGCKPTGRSAYCYYNNFGGIGCTKNQVPDGLGVNCAFPPAHENNLGGKVIGSNSCTGGDYPPSMWNSQSAVGDCNSVCANSTRSTYDCGMSAGGDCYPQQSYTTKNDANLIVAWPTVQCSRRFESVEAFLNAKIGFIQYCMPYNTSVYDFAYCIGASSYASEVQKGPILAEIIEKNCLCGSRDASGCKRDMETERKLVLERIKINFTALERPCLEWFEPQSRGCKRWGTDYNLIANQVYERTKGQLMPRQYDVENL